MPVPQENLSFVEQASCLLLTMVQDIRSLRHHWELVSKTWFPIAARF